MNIEERKERFVRLLREHTDRGAIEWAQPTDDPGHVYCLLGTECVMFEVLGGDMGRVHPTDPRVVGIAAHCRNVCYMWVPTFPHWKTLLGLLRDAPVDDEIFARFQDLTKDLPTRVLEAMAKA